MVVRQVTLRNRDKKWESDSEWTGFKQWTKCDVPLSPIIDHEASLGRAIGGRIRDIRGGEGRLLRTVSAGTLGTDGLCSEWVWRDLYQNRSRGQLVGQTILRQGKGSQQYQRLTVEIGPPRRICVVIAMGMLSSQKLEHWSYLRFTFQIRGTIAAILKRPSQAELNTLARSLATPQHKFDIALQKPARGILPWRTASYTHTSSFSITLISQRSQSSCCHRICRLKHMIGECENDR